MLSAQSEPILKGVGRFAFDFLLTVIRIFLPFSGSCVRARVTYLIIVLFAISLNISAQQPVVLSWPLTSPYETALPSNVATLTFSAGRSVDSLSFSAEYGAMSSGWNTDNLDSEAYYEYQVTPAPGTSILINQMNFEVSLSRVNMRTSVQYSYDGFTSQKTQIGHTIYIGTPVPRNLPVKTSLRVSYPQTLSIRFYGWSTVDHNVTFHNRNVSFEGVAFGKDLIVETATDNMDVSPESLVVEPLAENTLSELPQTDTAIAAGPLAAMAVVPPGDTVVNPGSGERAIMGSSIYDNPGNNGMPANTFTVPAGVTCIKVEAWGGGGGGSNISNPNRRGGGGGGGAYASSLVTPVTPGSNYVVNVGAGGTGSSPGQNSTFNSSTVIAAGGFGGINNNSGAGAGGSMLVSNGMVEFAGGNGANGGGTFSGGGGGGAGSGGAGGNATGQTGGTGTVVNGGNGGNGVSGTSNGNIGIIHGGGGSGAVASSNTSVSGGHGANGLVVITYIGTIYTITPSGNFCFGSTVTIGLSGSETGIAYQLYRDGTAVGSLVTGTGSPISFGNQTIAGVYTVQGVLIVGSTSCTRPMTGTVVINVLPTITLGTNPSVCQGVTTANLPYTATSGSPNQYSIDYNAAANAAGFIDITNSALAASPIVLVVPAAAPAGTYLGNLTVRNSTTGCVSVAYPISITINAVPVAPTAAISDRNNFCTDDPGNISLSVTGGSGTTLRWFTGSCGGTSIGTGNPLVIASPTVTTTYYARWETPTCGFSTCASVTVSILPPPATPGPITGISPVCPGISQTYSIAAVPNASTYNWTMPGGWTITSGNGTTSIQVTTGAAGGTISVTAGNACGTSAASTMVVIVSPGTPATPGLITGTAAQCPNLTNQTYSIAAVANATTYTWTVPTGWTITGGAGTNTITVTTGNTGDNGNITVTAGNSCGTSPASILAVTVGAGTPATPGPITGTTIHCNQQFGQIYSIVAVPNATSYNWTVPGGWTVTAGSGTNSITVTTGLPGQNGDITVTAQNTCGTSGVSSLAVSVTKPPDQAGSILPVITDVCQAGTYTFYVTTPPPAGVIYTWSVPSDWIINSGQGTASINVTVGATSGNITITPSNICGNGPSNSLALIVDLLPLAAGSITGNDEICEGSEQTFSILPVTLATSYQWSVPAGWTINSGQGTTQIVVTTGLASGVVQVIPVNSCGNGTASTLNVTVNPLPVAYTGPDGDICVGGTVQIGGPAVSGNTYYWVAVPPDPEMNVNISDPWITPEEDTWYTLLETNTTTGCFNTNSVFVQAKQDIFIYPNPTEQTICSGENAYIQIGCNILGAIITWEAILTSGSGVTGYSDGSGNLINQTLTNSSGAPAVVTYYITAKGNSTDECLNKEYVEVTVNPVTTPTISGPSAVCENSGGNVYNTESGMTAYIWTVSGGTITAGQGTMQITVTWNTPGVQTVNLLYDNIYGCTGTSASYNVTVNPIPTATALPATQGPVCPGGTITPIDITSIVSGTTYTWTRDNTTVLTGIPASGSSNPIAGSLSSSQPATLQTTVFNIVATANGCSFTTQAEVIVGDITPPTITCQSSPQVRNANTGGCNYTVVGVELDPVSYGDNCPGSTIRNNFNNLSTLAGAVLPQGTTNIVWTVTAANLQTATCLLTVNVTDNQAPVIINCPVDFTVYTGPGRTTCDQVATWTEPTATDNCGGAVSWVRSHIPGSIFPVGTTTVTYTATDGSGNSATCSFVITVIDNTPPTFTPPANLTIYVNASCSYNASISITGDVNNEADNCPLGGAQAVFTDAVANGPCPGTFVITRTWTLTDAHSNTTTHNQIITVADNIAPALTVPGNITIQCDQSTLPALTGQATATDNCGGPVTIIYSDNTVPGSCAYASTITRTWRATDCSGNERTLNQTINVIDNIPPVASIPNVTVACPSNIPPRNINAVTASDNCGSVTVVYLDEVPYGLENQPGYCPYRVDRTYRVTDECGNFTDVTQVITISSTCGCSPCATSNSFYIVDLDGQPSGTITYYNVEREDKCCDATKEDCVSFNVRIDDDAVGVQISIDGATPSPQDWRIDCESVSIIGNIVCIPGGQFYLFTYCKPGGNRNNFTFTSIPGIVATAEITTRVDCNTQITIENSNVTNPVWNSVFPGFPGQYNGYLSCTTCPNPIFTPDEYSPPLILYQVCGGLPASPCIASGVGCDTVTIHVIDSISVTFNVDPGAFCQGNVPDILATVTPPGVYTLSWYDAYDGSNGTGSIVGTGYGFTPPGPGQYSLEVNGMDGDIPCSQYIYNFDVAPDDVPPVVTAPPDLTLECNDPTNNQQIQDWLSLATATDDHTLNLSIFNDYAGINQTCNSSVLVTFTATDECNNSGTDNATIYIIDTQSPTWNTSPGALNRTVECSDATALAAAQALVPSATDLCDPATLVITKTSGAFVPGSCPQAGTYTNTWTATDLCGNVSAVYTQVITITDINAPVWTTLAGSLNRNIDCDDFSALAAAQALLPVATDNCDGTLTPVKTAGALVPGSCANAGSYTNTFVVTDDCGNTSNVFTQIITIYDPNGPILNQPAANLTVECDGSGNATELSTWLNNNGGAVATDACGPVTWAHNFTTLSDLCGATGSATVIFTATDGCFNSITTSANFTITDTQPPVITCPANVVGQIDPLTCESTTVVLGMATATDACSATGEIVITNNAPSAFPPGVTIVIWTATDACGNSATCQQTVTVEDLVPPTVDCPLNVSVNADMGHCAANVIVPAPVVTDPCPYTITNSFNGTANASGTYPVGTTTVTWTITGISGNITTCTQLVTVTDTQVPTITCPGNQLFTAPPPNCVLLVTTIPEPELADNCGIAALSLTWELTGATTGTGTGSVNGTTFNVGITLVTYIAYDAAGNSATCEFEVWIKSLIAPEFEANCPDDMTVYTTIDRCDADVVVTRPEIINPCLELYTITCVSPHGENPDGVYPVGTTTITWTITDASGNVTTCPQDIIVIDNIPPALTCPPPFEVDADFELPYATDVVIPVPTYSDACLVETLTWVLSGTTSAASPLTGINELTVYTLNIGLNIITYTATDFNGNVSTCQFEIFVNSEPVIECAADIEVNNDEGLCSASLDPGVPTLISGLSPTWHWVIRDEDNNIIGEGDGRPITPVPFTFPVGENTITWTATNISGFDECVQTITVTDNEDPTFTAPGPFNFCVLDIFSALFDGQPEPEADIIPEAIYLPQFPIGYTRPDWYIINNGNTILDLTELSDNCCLPEDAISWVIDFDDYIGQADITGDGQPSESPSIKLWGTPDYREVTHTITYTVTDCNGNATTSAPVNIIIRPRPNVIKQ